MKDQHFLFAIGFTDCLKMTAMQEAVLVLSQGEKKLLICPFFSFLFLYRNYLSLVTECIFWQLSNQTYFGFHPNIKTCQKNLHTHHGISIKRHAVLDNWLYSHLTHQEWWVHQPTSFEPFYLPTDFTS